MLNLKRCSFLICINLLSLSYLTAQDSTNTTIDTSNNGNFVTANIDPVPEATVTINQDPRIQTLLNIKSKMEKDGDFSDRYKIQLYYGNLNKANEIMRSAREEFPKLDVSIQFETPNYKVWMGNYRTRLEADKALKEVHTKFPSAFIFRPEKK